jgi:hypothetical protein
MSTFGAALADALRLQEAERVAFAAAGDDDLSEAVLAVSNAADAAVLSLLNVPAENGAQAAAKLSIAASHYDLSAGGLPDPAVGQIVAECVRFLGAAHLTGAAA